LPAAGHLSHWIPSLKRHDTIVEVFKFSLLPKKIQEEEEGHEFVCRYETHIKGRIVEEADDDERSNGCGSAHDASKTETEAEARETERALSENTTSCERVAGQKHQILEMREEEEEVRFVI